MVHNGVLWRCGMWCHVQSVLVGVWNVHRCVVAVFCGVCCGGGGVACSGVACSGVAVLMGSLHHD